MARLGLLPLWAAAWLGVVVGVAEPEAWVAVTRFAPPSSVDALAAWLDAYRGATAAGPWRWSLVVLAADADEKRARRLLGANERTEATAHSLPAALLAVFDAAEGAGLVYSELGYRWRRDPAIFVARTCGVTALRRMAPGPRAGPGSKAYGKPDRRPSGWRDATLALTAAGGRGASRPVLKRWAAGAPDIGAAANGTLCAFDGHFFVDEGAVAEAAKFERSAGAEDFLGCRGVAVAPSVDGVVAPARRPGSAAKATISIACVAEDRTARGGSWVARCVHLKHYLEALYPGAFSVALESPASIAESDRVYDIGVCLKFAPTSRIAPRFRKTVVDVVDGDAFGPLARDAYLPRGASVVVQNPAHAHVWCAGDALRRSRGRAFVIEHMAPLMNETAPAAARRPVGDDDDLRVATIHSHSRFSKGLCADEASEVPGVAYDCVERARNVSDASCCVESDHWFSGTPRKIELVSTILGPSVLAPRVHDD